MSSSLTVGAIYGNSGTCSSTVIVLNVLHSKRKKPLVTKNELMKW
jgi:hypothetical protein